MLFWTNKTSNNIESRKKSKLDQMMWCVRADAMCTLWSNFISSFFSVSFRLVFVIYRKLSTCPLNNNEKEKNKFLLLKQPMDTRACRIVANISRPQRETRKCDDGYQINTHQRCGQLACTKIFFHLLSDNLKVAAAVSFSSFVYSGYCYFIDLVNLRDLDNGREPFFYIKIERKWHMRYARFILSVFNKSSVAVRFDILCICW